MSRKYLRSVSSTPSQKYPRGVNAMCFLSLVICVEYVSTFRLFVSRVLKLCLQKFKIIYFEIHIYIFIKTLVKIHVVDTKKVFANSKLEVILKVM